MMLDENGEEMKGYKSDWLIDESWSDGHDTPFATGPGIVTNTIDFGGGMMPVDGYAQTEPMIDTGIQFMPPNIPENAEIPIEAVKAIKADGSRIKVFYVGTNKVLETGWMQNVELVEAIEQSDVVMFGHGPFLNAKIWGREIVTEHDSLIYKPDNARDIEDIKLFTKALKIGKKILGFGRGSHLCCSLSGGEVIQYVSHPNVLTMTVTNRAKWVKGNFSQHENRMLQYPQMIRDGRFIIIGKAVNASQHHIFRNGEDLHNVAGGDTFICLYETTGSLAIELFPWSANVDVTFVSLCNELLDCHVNGRISEFDANARSYRPDDDEFGDGDYHDEDEEWTGLIDENDNPIDENGTILTEEQIDEIMDAQSYERSRKRLQDKIEAVKKKQEKSPDSVYGRSFVSASDYSRFKYDEKATEIIKDSISNKVDGMIKEEYAKIIDNMTPPPTFKKVGSKTKMVITEGVKVGDKRFDDKGKKITEVDQYVLKKKKK